MKKALSLLLTAAMLLSLLTACAPSAPAASATPTPVPTATPVPVPVATDFGVTGDAYNFSADGLLAYLATAKDADEKIIAIPTDGSAGGTFEIGDGNFTLALDENSESKVTSVTFQWHYTKMSDNQAFTSGTYVAMLLGVLSPRSEADLREELKLHAGSMQRISEYIDNNGTSYAYTESGLPNCIATLIMTPEPTPTPAPTPAPASAPAQKSSGIIGSALADIYLSFDSFGLTSPKKDATDGTAFLVYDSCDNDALHMNFYYSLMSEDVTQLSEASFDTTWFGLGDNADFVSASTLYLAFAATFPYDASDTDTARAWVEDNISTLKDKEEISTTIGDAEFSLVAAKSGENYTAFILSVEKYTEAEK